MDCTRSPRIKQLSGFSQLQRRILMLALRNQERGEQVHFIVADAFQEVYGFVPARQQARGALCKQRFRVKEIGPQRYASAKVAVHKSLQRLMDRGLLVRLVNVLTERFAGVNLTDEGKSAAEKLTANLARNSGPSKQVESPTANLRKNLPPTKPSEAGIVGKTITLGGLTYEIGKFSGLWHFRLSPEYGWTACSEEMVDIIEAGGGDDA
jgi:DNA-binding MarR family transcriptional regulator